MLMCNGKPLICTYSDYGTVPANPDIAGIGVLTAFIATSVLTLTAIIFGYLLGAIPDERFNRLDRIVVATLRCWLHIKADVSEHSARARQKALERFILGLSDQQLVTGIAILVTGYAQTCKIDGYHFMILVAMAWFSSTTHLSTLVVLRDNFRACPPLRLLRVFGMVWVCAMLMFGEFLYFVTLDYYMVIKCAFTASSLQGTDPSCWQAAMMVSVYLIITYSNKITELYRDIPGGSVLELAFENLMTRKRSPTSRLSDTENELTKIYRESGSITGRQLRVLGTMCDFFFTELQDSFLWEIFWMIFGNFYGLLQLVTFRFIPPVPRVVGNDNQMLFGQLVPLFLLVLPLLAAVEAYHGTFNVSSFQRHSLTESSSHVEAQNRNESFDGSRAATVRSPRSNSSQAASRNQSSDQPNKDALDTTIETGDEDSLHIQETNSNPHDSAQHPRISFERFEVHSPPDIAQYSPLSPRLTLSHHTDTPWPLASGDLYTRFNLTRILWPMLTLIALGLTGFVFFFSGFAMPEDDTLFSYTVSLLYLLPLAAAHVNSFCRAFSVGKGP